MGLKKEKKEKDRFRNEYNVEIILKTDTSKIMDGRKENQDQSSWRHLVFPRTNFIIPGTKSCPQSASSAWQFAW